MKTPSKTSPKSGKRGCLCKDGTYSSKCCDGSLEAQGIGSITGTENVTIVVNEDGTRSTTRISG
jgi:hypothetical protein